jgi:uncharacterized protein (TIGR03000 family)
MYSYSATVPFGPPTSVPGKVPETTPNPNPNPKKPEGTNGKGNEGAARLIIEVPDGGKLYIDGQAMKATTTERLFYTPNLEAGQKYYYDVRVELMKDGQKVTESKRVIVQAGDVLRESFRNMDNAALVTAGRK